MPEELTSKPLEMHLELLLRDPVSWQKTEIGIYIPIAYWWQEGPRDTHIQFEHVGASNYCPRLNSDEEYVIPHVSKDDATLIAWHIAVLDAPLPKKDGWSYEFGVTDPYVTRLKALWGSPNE